MVHTQDIIDKYKLFWQYPAITEKQFYLQEKDNALYFGLPWATINDKIIDVKKTFKFMDAKLKIIFLYKKH